MQRTGLYHRMNKQASKMWLVPTRLCQDCRSMLNAHPLDLHMKKAELARGNRTLEKIFTGSGGPNERQGKLREEMGGGINKPHSIFRAAICKE